jgi:hypothetical protein
MACSGAKLTFIIIIIIVIIIITIQYSDKAAVWTTRVRIPERARYFFFPPKHPGRLWIAPTLLFSGTGAVSRG